MIAHGIPSPPQELGPLFFEPNNNPWVLLYLLLGFIGINIGLFWLRRRFEPGPGPVPGRNVGGDLRRLGLGGGDVDALRELIRGLNAEFPREGILNPREFDGFAAEILERLLRSGYPQSEKEAMVQMLYGLRDRVRARSGDGPADIIPPGR